MIGRNRSLRVGGMRHRILVQSVSYTTSQGQKVPQYATLFASEPAEYQYVRGAQTMHGRQVEEGVDAIFTVRYRDGYTERQRVVFNDETFGITFIRPIAGRDRFLELHCKTVKRQ